MKKLFMTAALSMAMIGISCAPSDPGKILPGIATKNMDIQKSFAINQSISGTHFCGIINMNSISVQTETVFIK